jgi:hypothetical protein
MDRSLRFVLFMTGTVLGGLLVAFAGKSTDRAKAEVDALGEELAIRDVPREEPDLDELAIREREQGERRAEAITAAADREAVDPDWGPPTQRQIVDRFATEAPPGTTLISATCKTTLCIAEIESIGRDGSIGPPTWMALFGLPRGFVLPPEPSQDGTYRSVVFLARDGHSLPKVN